MTRGGRYEQLNARRRREQFRGRLKAWLRIGALVALAITLIIIGTSQWRLVGQISSLQDENDRMRQKLHELIERTDKILTGTDQVRGYIKDLRPSLPDAVAGEIARYIAFYSRKYGVDSRIVVAMAYRESSFDRNAVGTVGERGLLQVSPETFKDFGRGDFRDWRNTLEAGVRYYAHLQRRYGGNVVLAISAYNAGPGNVVDQIPEIKSTQYHVRKVMLAFRGMRR